MKRFLQLKFLCLDWTSPRVGIGVGIFLTLFVGLICLVTSTRYSQLFNANYDWSLQLFGFTKPDVQTSPVVIVYMDEASYKNLDQPMNKPWDRALHAKLLDKMTADGPVAVVFDVIFSDPGPSRKADAEFEAAIRRNGRVILGAEQHYSGSSVGPVAVGMFTTTMPIERFQNVAAGVGMAELQVGMDRDFTVRRHYNGVPDLPTLSWKCAELLELPVATHPSERSRERWINYYGGAGIPYISYAKVLSHGVPRGFFHDKIVFIGARSHAGAYNERRDELRNPMYSWSDRDHAFMPAVEVHATEALNLVRGDSLSRVSPIWEYAVIIAVSVLFGGFLFKFKPLTATVVAVVGSLLMLLFAMGLFVCNVWFPWLVVVAIQIPVALLWCVVFKSLEWYAARMRMEEERRVAHEQIREQAALLDKAQDAIIVHDLNWRVAYWNRSAERVYGWPAEEVLERNLDRFVGGAMDKLQIAKAEALAKGEWSGELKQKTRAGNDITVQSSWSLVRDDAGAPKSILVINTDITEKKNWEIQFLRAQRMDSIGTLAGGIAHDLNNVLSPIVMGAELLVKTEKDEKRLKLLKTMATSAARGADMVKQVLTFARGHEGERARIQITHILKEMQKVARETFPKSIVMETKIAPDAAMILGDATQVHQILLNLCVNARDAMPDGGKIVGELANVKLDETAAKKIAGAKPGTYVVLSVTDSGMGIPAEIQDKIFEPFFTTKEIGKGTGLGLSTVISIIKGHDAFLELISEVGKGSTFRIYFPAVQAPAASSTAATSLEQLSGEGELVLVVDDEQSIVEMTRTILTEFGYRVLTAGHGGEAVAAVEKHSEPIRLAIVDMMMPVMDGPKTIKALKKMHPEMKFVAVSGLQQTDEIKQQFAAMGIPFLPKPFNTEKLLLTVKKEFGTAASSMAAAA